MNWQFPVAMLIVLCAAVGLWRLLRRPSRSCDCGDHPRSSAHRSSSSCSDCPLRSSCNKNR